MRIHLSVSLGVGSVLVLSCAFVGATSSWAAPLATFTVEAGAQARVDTPVSAPLAGVPEAMSGVSLRLEEIKGSQRVGVPAQVEPGATPRLWWILAGTTLAGATRVFELVEGEPAQAQAVRAVKNDKFLDIVVGGQNVLQYNHAIVPLPAELGNMPEARRRLYDRSGFIHPLWSPKGSVLTDIHPPDHFHHMGIWMPWTHTRYEGKMVDFWNVGDGTGTVRFVKYLSTTEGPVYGGFRSEQEHVALKTSKGEQVILKEVWDVRAFNVGGPETGYWLVDFKSTQRCVAPEPLIQEEYRYGGLGFRAARQWKGENAANLTSEGKTRVDGHATRARWCDNAGVIDGQWEGVTFYSHPANFGHPEPMRLWPEPDNYIFFNFCPSQLGEWEMDPGVDHVFQYRWYVHEGKIVVADAERVWNDYADPPQVKAVFARPAGATALFDGTDPELSLWQRDGGGEIGWQVADDVMQITPDSGSIVTKQPYRDFMLHVEFKTPDMPQAQGQGRGNSGVYLQKRYEVQILDSYGLEPKNNDCGAIYQVKAPDVNACKKPDEWQSYDILFHAARFEGTKKVADARITVYQNGAPIHDDVAIPNKTGAGRPEGPEPGPILLQDHGNRVSFRNIWIKAIDER